MLLPVLARRIVFITVQPVTMGYFILFILHILLLLASLTCLFLFLSLCLIPLSLCRGRTPALHLQSTPPLHPADKIFPVVVFVDTNNSRLWEYFMKLAQISCPIVTLLSCLFKLSASHLFLFTLHSITNRSLNEQFKTLSVPQVCSLVRIKQIENRNEYLQNLSVVPNYLSSVFNSLMVQRVQFRVIYLQALNK